MEWIDVSEYKPEMNTVVEAQLYGGQFVGRWTQDVNYKDGHFYEGEEINLDKEVYAWRYKT